MKRHLACLSILITLSSFGSTLKNYVAEAAKMQSFRSWNDLARNFFKDQKQTFGAAAAGALVGTTAAFVPLMKMDWAKGETRISEIKRI